MVPDKKEWRSWNSLEKATYFAQLATLPALLFTVGFSYLSWRETRAAQEQERAFFIAQNPPKLDLVAARVLDSSAGPLVFFYIRNVGDSAAKSPCARFERLIDNGATQLLTTNCTANDPYAGATLRKGESVTYHIPQEGYFEFKPTSVQILRPEEPAAGQKCRNEKADMLLVTLRYTDVLEQPYGAMRQALLCG